MEHQALARKWRPRSFDQMVGQEHVLKALINALDQDRLHHAYLFTGTRGVGKTTLARILSKCLNCETGVSSKPCNECSTCTEINEGRCIDLIEVDAASRTKVEDTRELLDNVQYAPTRARYKVYLIDEVHMLSTHSFNALLKTLEEPPPHVKFLLATTDPQKLPVTVLSRCLQFNLKNLAPERIVGHLKHVLEAEDIAFDDSALWQLGRAADGSMRDALSLTDQAVAYGENSVYETDVSAMLGSIDRGRVYQIVDALINEDAAGLLQQVKELAEFSPDYMSVLEQLLSVLHKTAVAQVAPEAFDESVEDSERILTYAQQLTGEDLQLYYQIALTGRGDLPLNPDQRSGLEMLLLRMLVFRPDTHPETSDTELPRSAGDNAHPAKKKLTSNTTQPLVQASAKPQSVDTPVSEAPRGVSKAAQALALVNDSTKAPPKLGLVVNNIEPQSVDAPEPTVEEKPARAEPEPESEQKPDNKKQPASGFDAQSEYATELQSLPEMPEYLSETPPDDFVSINAPQDSVPVNQNSSSELSKSPVEINSDSTITKGVTETEKENITGDQQDPLTLASLNSGEDWVRVVQRVKLRGMSKNILMQCAYKDKDSNNIRLLIDKQYIDLINATHQQRIVETLSETLGCSVNVNIEAGAIEAETPAVHQQRLRAERLDEAKLALENDENVQQLIEQFGAVLDIDSIEPLD